MNIPPPLLDVAEKVKQGQAPSHSVREFISWFWGSKRRGSFVVSIIRQALGEVQLRTSPDFDATYLDGLITFIPAAAPPVQNDVGSEMNISAGDSMVMVDSAAASVKVDPSYRVARLTASH